MNRIPDFVILNIEQIVHDCVEQLTQSWIFTVDVEFILQNLFQCFIDVQNSSSSLKQFLHWLQVEGLEVKSDNTPLQVEFVLHVVEQTGLNILDVLTEYGYHTFEYFPYEFKKINRDNSVILSRVVDYPVRT